MRGWSRWPIRKASRPNHGLGIHATHNLVEEGKKGRVVGVEEDCEECREESQISRVQGRTENKGSEF
jgi:hypothetical protein